MGIDGDIKKYLNPSFSLRKLAGLYENGSEFSNDLEDNNPSTYQGIMSIETITLSQYRYERVFEMLGDTIPNFHSLSLDAMSRLVDEALLSSSHHYKPHIRVYEGTIVIVIDCLIIDSQIMDYASQLLNIIPDTTDGFYWEYLT